MRQCYPSVWSSRNSPPNLGGEFNSEASHHSFGLRRERGSLTVYFAIFTLIFLGLMTICLLYTSPSPRD